MADRVQIRSIDDIERFRAQLLTFLNGARVAVEESAIDVSHQQAWLDLDRRKYWEGELWRRQRTDGYSSECAWTMKDKRPARV